MFINEFVAGILATLFVELILLVGVFIYYGTKK